MMHGAEATRLDRTITPIGVLASSLTRLIRPWIGNGLPIALCLVCPSAHLALVLTAIALVSGAIEVIKRLRLAALSAALGGCSLLHVEPSRGFGHAPGWSHTAGASSCSILVEG